MASERKARPGIFQVVLVPYSKWQRKITNRTSRMQRNTNRELHVMAQVMFDNDSNFDHKEKLHRWTVY